MPGKQSPTTGVTNPWYPEGGPGRHLKSRLASGEVVMGAMLSEHARPSLVLQKKNNSKLGESRNCNNLEIQLNLLSL